MRTPKSPPTPHGCGRRLRKSVLAGHQNREKKFAIVTPFKNTKNLAAPRMHSDASGAEHPRVASRRSNSGSSEQGVRGSCHTQRISHLDHRDGPPNSEGSSEASLETLRASRPQNLPLCGKFRSDCSLPVLGLGARQLLGLDSRRHHRRGGQHRFPAQARARNHASLWT